MTLEELEARPHEELVLQAIAIGLKDSHKLEPYALARAILVRIGEKASQEDWDDAYVFSQITDLKAELAGLRATIGPHLHRLDETASHAKHLASIALMTRTHPRSPTPKEIALLPDRDLLHLAEGLLIDPVDRTRAGRLNQIAAKLSWEWGDWPPEEAQEVTS